MVGIGKLLAPALWQLDAISHTDWMDLISKLLNPDSKKKTWSQGNHFFKDFEWDKLRRMKAAFVSDDVINFEKEGGVYK